MLLRISELLEVLFMFFGVNYICGKSYRFYVCDILFFIPILLIIDFINLGYIDNLCMMIGYILLAAYVIVKFHLKFKEFMVCISLFLLYKVVLELICSVPIFLLDGLVSGGLLVMAAHFCACLATVYIGKKQILWKMFFFIRQNGWLMRGIIFCCGLGVFYLIIVTKFTYTLRITDHIIFGLWIILICILAVKWQKGKNEIEIKRREMELQKTYDDAYQNLVQSIRRRQHEFDNHLVALCGIYKTVDTIEELIAEQKIYCSEIERDNHYNKLLSAGSPMLVGFLYSKFMYAEERNCYVHYFVNIAEDNKGFVPEYRIIEMLGILIDNAVEALEDSGLKQLSVEIMITCRELQILVKNISKYIPQSEIFHFVQFGYSSKGEGRGLGLASLSKLVNNYHGQLAVYNEEIEAQNWLTFKVVIENQALSA